MVTVREARQADAGPIAEVQVRSWQAAYRGLIPDDVLARLSVRSRTERWSGILADPPARTCAVLAVDGPVVLGFASTGPVLGGGEGGALYALYLAPEVWGRGIGTQLHAAALARLRTAGFGRATLWVLEGNDRALRFYLREGWSETGRTQLDEGPEGVPLHERELYREPV